MFGDIWVTFDDSECADWAATVALQLARAAPARVTFAHVTAPEDEPVDDREELGRELLGSGGLVRARQRIAGHIAGAACDVETRVRVASGPVAPTLLELLLHGHPDLIVATASGPLRFGRLPGVVRTLAAHGPCPLLVLFPAGQAGRTALI